MRLAAGGDCDDDVLGEWLARRQPAKHRRARAGAGSSGPGLRFAFYGRMSTADHQDRFSSRRWQLDNATELVAGRGRIVAEFFDVGVSRRVGWPDRPRAAELLAAAADPAHGFDAIVVGEYERAFCGSQLVQLAPVLARHGVSLWLPEFNGPVDLDNPVHQALTMLLGTQSQREVRRSRHRVLAAMCAQARDQGRYLGGRPPYGYRLADAGPHPNLAHARWGRRLHRLEPDPATAPYVRWMFAQRLAGYSVASIARMLNERGIPCPSGADPDRNPHRSGAAWSLRTVAAILANPRYTGRQVWNRQRTDHDLHEVDGLRGMLPIQRWTGTDEWIVSSTSAHPALVSEHDFVAVQAIQARRTTKDGTVRAYLLAGLLRCRLCGRRMDAHWVNHRPGYRCRHGHTTAQRRSPGIPRNLYVREDRILASLTARLADTGASSVSTARNLPPLPALSGGSPTDMVVYLRAHHLTIACDTGGWIIESDPSCTPDEDLRHRRG